MEIVTAADPGAVAVHPRGRGKIVVGAVAPASPDPIPVAPLPELPARIREWRHPATHEVHWLLERRKSSLARRRRLVAPQESGERRMPAPRSF